MTKGENYQAFVVTLGGLEIGRNLNLPPKAVVHSTSDRGAISHLLGKLTNNPLDVGCTMNLLDDLAGGNAGNRAISIPTEFTYEDGSTIPQNNPDYYQTQRACVAQEIAEKTGSRPQECLQQADYLIEFFNAHQNH